MQNSNSGLLYFLRAECVRERKRGQMEVTLIYFSNYLKISLKLDGVVGKSECNQRSVRQIGDRLVAYTVHDLLPMNKL